MIAKCHFSAQDILSAAGDHICQRAAEVGIDGTRLLRDLPAPGRLLKGAALPVLARRYRGASCALLHINYTNNGQEWPFLLLMTFKDGGARTHFNGLRWLCQHDGREQRYEPTRYCVSIRQHDHRIEQCERKNRLRRHRALQHSYANGQALPVTHSWLRRRLCGLADASLLRRTTLRTTANGILAPLVHADGSCVGFHQITPHNKGDTKRHFVHTLGAMAGAFVFLASTVKDITLPPILCEGLVTGLTLALYWPGAVFVALSAGNLVAVRSIIRVPEVLICYDNDLWKQAVGNVGLQAAQRAAAPADHLYGPQFPSGLEPQCPTDFNDLLMLCGRQALRQQLEALWQFIPT